MGLFRKSGGGFLNGVNGVIQSITFDSKEWGEGEDAYTTLSACVKVLQDGAEDAVEQYLPAGFLYEDMSISADGKTIEGGNDGAVIQEGSEFAKFVQSAIETGGIGESAFDENGRNFEALEGLRVTFGKVLNKERQMAAGRKKLGKAKAAAASEDEIMKAGRRQDKNDKTKFYNHDQLVVSAVLGREDVKPAKGAKAKAGAKAAAPKSTAAKGGKANGAAKTVEEDYTAADALLVDLLADAKGNTINKASISSLIVRKALADDMDNETRDGFRKLLASDEYLAREAGWTFAASEKNQPIALA